MSKEPVKYSLIQRVGTLYNMLEARFPNYRGIQGHLDISGLAKALGYSNETIYKCVRSNTLTPTVALKMLKLSRATSAGNPLRWDDLLEFVLPEYDAFKKPEPTASD